MQRYEVERTDLDGSTAVVETTHWKEPFALDHKLNKEYGLYRYEVVAYEGAGGYGATSRSNEIILIQAPLLHVPNAFTPNGDALNETFNPDPVFVKDYLLRIYDRWGKQIFESKDKHVEFDGITTDGGYATGDVFVYHIMYTGWDESSHVRKGNFTILR
jgi:gliding motility-associated-like protein